MGHYGVYGSTPKRVMTAGVMSSETPLELSAACPSSAAKTKGFLYAPIMHRANTSCGNRTPPTPPTPPPPKPKPKPVLQVMVRSAESGKFIVEACTLAGNVIAKSLVEKDATLGSLRASLGVDAHLVWNDEDLDGPSDKKLLEMSFWKGVDVSERDVDSAFETIFRTDGAKVDEQTQVLVEWDVIDTVFVKKEDACNASLAKNSL